MQKNACLLYWQSIAKRLETVHFKETDVNYKKGFTILNFLLGITPLPGIIGQPLYPCGEKILRECG
jgi:hypothetical protein